MKKILLLVLFSVIFSLTSLAQVEDVKYDENNLYHKALEAVMKKRLTQYGNISEKEELTNITILQDYRTISLPNKIEGFNIDYLDDDELFIKFKKYRKNKNSGKSMRIMRVFPMKNINSKIEIRFTDIHYSRKDTRNNIDIRYGLEGGSIVTFAYDCETDKFIVENVELRGV